MAPPFLLLLRRRWSSTSSSIGPSPLPPSGSLDPSTIAVSVLSKQLLTISPFGATATGQISHDGHPHLRPDLPLTAGPMPLPSGSPDPSTITVSILDEQFPAIGPSSATNASAKSPAKADFHLGHSLPSPDGLPTSRPTIPSRLYPPRPSLSSVPHPRWHPQPSLPSSALLGHLFPQFHAHVGILGRLFPALLSSNRISYLLQVRLPRPLGEARHLARTNESQGGSQDRRRLNPTEASKPPSRAQLKPK